MGKSLNIETAISGAYSCVTKDLGVNQPNAIPSQWNSVDFTWSVTNVHVQLWRNV